MDDGTALLVNANLIRILLNPLDLTTSTQGCWFNVETAFGVKEPGVETGERCWSAGVETRKEVLRQVLRRTLNFFAPAAP